MRKFVHYHIMSKTIAWLLLTTYCCATCTAVLPIVQDVVAHLFWHKEHIEHVHQGQKNQHHVVIEMAQLLNEDQDQQAVFTALYTGKPGLSAHMLPGHIFKTANGTDWQIVAFPMLRFCLPKGIRSIVFLPPRGQCHWHRGV